MRQLTIYYDCISPYSWLAFEFLLSHQKKWNYQLVLKPIFLGAIMKASGNQPPAMVPNKGKYMIRDLQRWGELYGIQVIQHPDFFKEMFQGANLMRLVTSVQLYAPDQLVNVSRTIWLRLWQKQQSISEQYYQEILGDIDQNLKTKILTEIKNNDVKNNLKKNTDECIEQEAFGAPWIKVEVDGKCEYFFGQDKFEQIAHLLKVQYNGPKPKL